MTPFDRVIAWLCLRGSEQVRGAFPSNGLPVGVPEWCLELLTEALRDLGLDVTLR